MGLKLHYWAVYNTLDEVLKAYRGDLMKIIAFLRIFRIVVPINTENFVAYLNSSPDLPF